MENTLSTQLATIDYEYIKANYLNQEVWGKKWNIYNYSGMSVTLSLSSIQVSSGYASVEVRVKVVDDLFEDNVSEDYNWISVPLFRDDYTDEMFKLSIFKVVARILKDMELIALKNTSLYAKIDEYESGRIEELKALATDYMYSQNVYNKTIIKAYVDEFVLNNFIGFAYKLDYNASYSRGHFLNKHYQLFASFSQVDCPEEIRKLTGLDYKSFLSQVEQEFEDFKKRDLETDYSVYLTSLDEEA